MRALMRALQSRGFEDVAALVALYRPALWQPICIMTMPTGRHGNLLNTSTQMLKNSGIRMGLMIYQESVMRVAQKFAGYTLAQADNLRKAMGKNTFCHGERTRKYFGHGKYGI